MLTDKDRDALGERIRFLRGEEVRLRAELERTMGELDSATGIAHDDFQERQWGKSGKPGDGRRRG